MEHFVEFEDVCKYYQTGSVKIAAADHLNFYVDKGEFCIIVGPSGAGKTTLLNILGGMDNCDEGNVWLDGRNVSRFSARELTTYRRYDVGFVFQFYNLVQNLTAPARRNTGLMNICSWGWNWGLSGVSFSYWLSGWQSGNCSILPAPRKERCWEG